MAEHEYKPDYIRPGMADATGHYVEAESWASTPYHDVVADLPTDDLDVTFAAEELSEQSKAHRFIDLIQKGAKPADAARKLGLPYRGMMRREEVRSAIKALLESYTIPKEIEKRLVRSLQWKIAIENSETDPDLTLKATKQIADDPNVGMGQAPININLDAGLRDIMGKVSEDDYLDVSALPDAEK